LVTSFFPAPPEPLPWAGLDTLLIDAARRLQEFDAAGSFPDGADYREWRAAFDAQLSALLQPLARHGKELGWEYRRKLGIVGAATRNDVPRLVDLLQQECGFEIKSPRCSHGGYFGADPEAPCRGVVLPYLPADVTGQLVELIGAFLAPWPRPHYRIGALEALDIWRLVEFIDATAAHAFAGGWWDGPDLCYAAADPGAQPLLATRGLDHFPTLEEAQQLARREVDAPEVQCAKLTQPYLMRCQGVVLFLFPHPGPNAGATRPLRGEDPGSGSPRSQ
jgi:hypothetical protein